MTNKELDAYFKEKYSVKDPSKKSIKEMTEEELDAYYKEKYSPKNFSKKSIKEMTEEELDAHYKEKYSPKLNPDSTSSLQTSDPDLSKMTK